MRQAQWRDLETFLLSSRDLCPTTTKNTLMRLRFLERHGMNLRRPKRGSYDAFLAERKRESNAGPGLRHYGRALRHLLAYRRIHWPDFRLPRCPAPVLDIMPDVVVHRLTHYGDGPEDTGWTDDMETARFAFTLGNYCALRCPSEHHDLEVPDYDADNQTLRVWSDKTERYRTLDLEPWLATTIDAYLEGTRRRVASAHHKELIVRPTGGHWSREGYRMWLGRHGRRIHKDYRCRKMRSWGATYRLIATDLDVYYVKDYLGHQRISSTEYYLKIARDILRRRAHAHKVQPLICPTPVMSACRPSAPGEA